MANKYFRRLARDHASLHSDGLPPNYLFHPNTHNSDSFNSLAVYLVGPVGSPYDGGIFHLDLSIPSTYPTSPPTAFFRTKVFHPNVDPATGAVCVETLKRDWTPELTLRHVLLTIYCLLLYPNPSSALNEDAGLLVEKDYPTFERRAALWTNMHAAIPKALEAQVEEARKRGEEMEVRSTSPKGSNLRQEKRKKEEGLSAHKPDENQSQDQAPSSRNSSMRVSFHTPAQPLQASQQGAAPPQRPVQTPMDLDTPTLASQVPSRAQQPPAPPLRSRRLRERYTLNRSSAAAPATTPMNQASATPVPTTRPPPPPFRMPRSLESTSQSTNIPGFDSFQTANTHLTTAASAFLTPSPSRSRSPSFHTGPATDAEPKLKRLRLSTSPSTIQKTNQSLANQEKTPTTAFDRASLTPEIPLDQYMLDVPMSATSFGPVSFPWLHWSAGLLSNDVDGIMGLDVDMDAENHREQEQARWKLSGGCVDRYNSGCFGPRTGVMRL